jgi:hypothetical protein
MENKICISYEPEQLEYIFPYFKKLITYSCTSADRTNLFIVSFIRLTIFIIIWNIIDTPYVVAIIIVNIMYLFLILSKNTYFSFGKNKSISSVEFDKKKLNY